MTRANDLLAEIEQRYRDDPNMYWVTEVEWLIGEAKRRGSEIERLNGALAVEHEIQRLLLERLGIEWTPGEPFYSLVEGEVEQLRAELRAAKGAWRESEAENDQWQKKLAEVWAENTRLRDELRTCQETLTACLESES